LEEAVSVRGLTCSGLKGAIGPEVPVRFDAHSVGALWGALAFGSFIPSPIDI
jgi:hypothetical protein